MTPQDRTTDYHEAIGELARAHGVTFDVLYEEFAERAAVREYDGNMSKAEAEQKAMDDLRERLQP